MKPTDQQAEIVDTARNGDNLIIEAGAGTGKTSTLRLLAADRPKRRGLYLAFNKAVATEAAGSFGPNMRCKTAHSLAFSSVGRQYAHRLNGARLRSRDIAEIFDRLNPAAVALGTEHLNPAALARVAMETVQNFCRSAEHQTDRTHVPYVPGVPDKDRPALETAAVLLANTAWNDLTSLFGDLRFEHDHYLKMWQLTCPKLPFDVVMLDEAQDCQPAGTVVLTPSGPVKIEDVRAGDRVVSYTGSGLRLRMKGSFVNSIRSRDHDGEIIQVSTATGLKTSYTPEHICIAKIGPALEGKTLLYLMRKGDSWRVGVTSPFHGRKRPSSGVAGRLREERGDAIWILATYQSKADALLAEAAIPARYGIPEMRFQDNGQQSFGQERMDSFWASFGDLTKNAEACLAAFGRDIRYPLAARSFTEAGARNGYLMYSRASTIRACNLMAGMQVLDVRPLTDRRSQVAKRHGDPAWTPITVRRDHYVGKVWSLDVDEDHTYVGDGIATHNCNPVIAAIVDAQTHAQRIAVGDQSQAIYGWRGAIDAMSFWPWKRLALTQSFRFGPNVADQANLWLDWLDATLRLEGSPDLDTTVGWIDQPDAILTRGNVSGFMAAVEQLDNGVDVGIVGGVTNIKKLAYAARDLQAGRPTDNPELCAFDTWEDVREYAENDTEGADLKTFVGLIDRRGPGYILAVADSFVREDRAEVVVSTAHKAKGREWPRVQIGSDFPEPKVDEYGNETDITREDAMLAYVAVTRARAQLDTGSLHWINNLPVVTP